jgi:hypothetical protein
MLAINSREFSLEKQIQQEFGISTVVLLSRSSSPANLGWIAKPRLNPEILEETLEPIAIATCFQSDHHRWLELSVKLM